MHFLLPDCLQTTSPSLDIYRPRDVREATNYVLWYLMRLPGLVHPGKRTNLETQILAK